MKTLGRVGLVGRFRPFHIGAATAIDCICEQAEEVVIGIGSANKYDLRNPFTADETQSMIDAYLSSRHDNYTFVHLNDYGHLPEFSDGQRWREEVLDKFGSLDVFISGNAWVRDLLKGDYFVAHPVLYIPEERRVPVSGTMTRLALAMNDSWEALIPKETTVHLTAYGLDSRFRAEFGYDTIMSHLQGHGQSPVSVEEEKVVVRR
jgi:nicotinamide-nucleotide adenylyltransferase